ncbi:hypothetical protein SHK09_15035 [Polaribacter sp. PL03]|uniref:hypothetical protein n=1 Tax=Polaribacter sp. PL03 TaxID=3088353 RepID=UPI0029D3A6D6|nr:hypothetical protein [Polaribacter sp. PL03]MDX6748110.1 hypothetical protein [Polaribacter sp. PL03]
MNENKKSIDEIISALYLAKTDNREKMLSDLILTVMYNIDSKVNLKDLNSHIDEIFHLKPIEYELQECLDNLVENKKISCKNEHYRLLDVSTEYIHKTQLQLVSTNKKRYNSFKEIIITLSVEIKFEETDITLLWNVFNEYLLECFMTFGKKAINIFLPYKNDFLGDDSALLEKFTSKFENTDLIKVFKKLTLEYPNLLNDAELRHLTSLATRAEKFYSLGVLKEEYEQIKNLQIKDLTVVLDTNILYSILELRKHPEDTAINEIIRIAREKQIDLRLVFLPKTNTELQKARNYLEKIIPKENFKISHIKALIESDKLDSFAKKYYLNKLDDSETPHPSQKVRYASDVLKNMEIIIYNNVFKELDDNKELLNESLIEYKDYERYFNNKSDLNGWKFKLNKDINKIEHDVFLRESIKILKSKFSNENEMKFVCLTLDRSLIGFDQHTIKTKSENDKEVINPNFVLPSLFIKKIRPFIPIITNNYRKAFITSLTVPDYEKEDFEESLVVQKSMSFFKKLGIDDEEIIINCIKRELFLNDFLQHEKDNTVELFIKSEIAIELDQIKDEKESLAQKIKDIDIENTEKIITLNHEKNEIVKEKINIVSKKDNDIEKLEKNLSEKEKTIENLNERIEKIEKEQQRVNSENEEKIRKQKFTDTIKTWESEKNDFVKEQWMFRKKEYAKALIYSIIVFLFLLLVIAVGLILKVNKAIVSSIVSYGINEWFIWGGLIFLIAIALFARSFIFDKTKVKNGWIWLITKFNKKNETELKAIKEKEFIEVFLSKNKKPIYSGDKD